MSSKKNKNNKSSEDLHIGNIRQKNKKMCRKKFVSLFKKVDILSIVYIIVNILIHFKQQYFLFEFSSICLKFQAKHPSYVDTRNSFFA